MIDFLSTLHSDFIHLKNQISGGWTHVFQQEFITQFSITPILVRTTRTKSRIKLIENIVFYHKKLIYTAFHIVP